MVDNRSAGVLGIGGSLNFKSGDISGTAAKTSDEKMGQGSEYFAVDQGEENQNFKEAPFMDRSAQLNATLNSLAMMNVAGMMKNNKMAKKIQEDKKAKELIAKRKAELDDEYDYSSEDEEN